MEGNRIIDNHIIITHCNLEGFDIDNIYSGNPSWMEYRLGIFEEYTLSSLSNQTDPGFHLLMFCHTNTPKPYKQKLLDLEEKYDFLKLMWDQTHFTGHGGEVPSFYNSIKKAYLEVRKNNSNEVICSRMGTDDMAEARFNEVIKNLTQKTPTLSLAGGLYWDIIENKFLDSMFPTGPFISVKSTISDFKGDMREISHHHIINQTNGSFIMNKDPLWIQVCSGTNVWNSLEKMPGEQINHPGEEYLEINFGFKKE